MNTKPVNCAQIDFDLWHVVKRIITSRFSGSEEDVHKIILTVSKRIEANSNQQDDTNTALDILPIIEKMTIYEIDHLKSKMAKNFGITEIEFNSMIAQLKTHETVFFEKVFISHFNDCKNYLMNNYKAHENDAYDASMDTLLEFRERLVDGKIKYGNLRFLFTKMASQIYFRKMKSFKSQEIQEKDIQVNETEEFDPNELLTLKKSWLKLGDNCKELLKNHYYGRQRLTDIAEEKGVSSSTVRKQKERCMNRLRLLFVQHTQI